MAATETAAPGASSREPFLNQTAPPVTEMRPGVKLEVGDEVAVSPSSSGRLAVTEPLPKETRPIRCGC